MSEVSGGQKLATAYVEIRANMEHLKPELEGATGELVNWMEVVKGLGEALGIGLGIEHIREMMNEGVRAYEKASNSAFALKAIIEGTGEAAGYTWEYLMKLSEELQETTTVASGTWREAMISLSKFHRVVGDVFEDAIRVAGDWAVAMGHGPEGVAGAAAMVGRALEDPIRGLRILRKHGIDFTQSQTRMIEQWVRSGELLKAQRYLLDRISKAAPGAAKALAETPVGKMKQARNALDSMYEVLGEKLVPVWTAWYDLQTKTVKILSDIVDKAKKFADVLKDVFDKFKEIDKATGGLVSAVGVMSGFAAVASGLVNLQIVGWITHFGSIAKGVFLAIVPSVFTLAGGFTLLGAGIVAVVAGFAYWVAQTSEVQAALGKLWDKLKYSAGLIYDSFKMAWDGIIEAMKPLAGHIMFVLNGLREMGAEASGSWLGSFGDSMMTASEYLSAWLQNWDKIPEVAGAAMQLAEEEVTNVLTHLQESWTATSEFIAAIWGYISDGASMAGQAVIEAWTYVSTAVTGELETMYSFAEWLFGMTGESLSEWGTEIGKILMEMDAAFKQLIFGPIMMLSDALYGLFVELAPSWIRSLIEAIGEFVPALKAMADAAKGVFAATAGQDLQKFKDKLNEAAAKSYDNEETDNAKNRMALAMDPINRKFDELRKGREARMKEMKDAEDEKFGKDFQASQKANYDFWDNLPKKKEPKQREDKPLLHEGFVGFTDLNKKMQEAILKADDPMIKLVGIAEGSKKVEEMILDESRKTRVAVEKKPKVAKE